MAITRHQRDSSLTPFWISAGTQPVLLTQARIRKPTANIGSSGGLLPVGSAPCMRVTSAAQTITGTSMATRISFTTVAVSPVSVDML
ncbi:hypothetical protein D3C84_632010 [compost metagenome]